MIDYALQTAYDQIMLAVLAEDVFGEINPDDLIEKQLGQLTQRHEKLLLIVDPNHYKMDLEAKEFAFDACERLKAFYAKAQEKIKLGIYGSARSSAKLSHRVPDFETAKRQYFLGPVLAQGDIATIYSGECVMSDEFAGQVVVKIIDDEADNDFGQNEIRVLNFFQQHPSSQRKHLPVLLDHFRLDDGRLGIVLRKLEGYDFCVIRENPRYRNGIPEKHMVWMLSRILSAIGYSHSIGVVHCNLEPSHFIARPKDHNIFCIDWSYAAIDPSHTADRFKVFNEEFSPPEVKEKKPPLPSSDLYSIGMCMIYLLGGDLKTKEMPDAVHPQLQQFLKYFVLESPLQRAHDAWQAYGQLDHLVRGLWGPKKFLDFVM